MKTIHPYWAHDMKPGIVMSYCILPTPMTDISFSLFSQQTICSPATTTPMPNSSCLLSLFPLSFSQSIT